MVIDACDGRHVIVVEGPDSEARLEQEERDRLHEFDGVDLVIEERLLVPHGAHEKLLVLEDERDDARN